MSPQHRHSSLPRQKPFQLTPNRLWARIGACHTGVRVKTFHTLSTVWQGDRLPREESCRRSEITKKSLGYWTNMRYFAERRIRELGGPILIEPAFWRYTAFTDLRTRFRVKAVAQLREESSRELSCMVLHRYRIVPLVQQFPCARWRKDTADFRQSGACQ